MLVCRRRRRRRRHRIDFRSTSSSLVNDATCQITDSSSSSSSTSAVARTSLDALSTDLVAHVVDSCGSTFEERWHACVALECVCTSTRAAAHAWASAQTIASLCTRIHPPSSRRSLLLAEWMVPRALARLHVHLRVCFQTYPPLHASQWNVLLLAQRCNALNVVTLVDACDADVVALARHCPVLQDVDVRGCASVTDVGVVALARSTCAPHLRSLWLCNDASTPTRDAITNLALVELGRACPNLEQLHMNRVRRWSPSSRTQVTHVGVEALARGCPKLTHLNVSRLPLHATGFDAVAAHCARLAHLDVANCDYFDDAVALALGAARCASTLTHLDARRCSALTEVGVVHLARHCSNLEHVQLWGKLGDEVALAIADHCHRTLQTLSFTSAMLQRVSAITHKCTQLRSLSLTTDRMSNFGFDPRCDLLEHLSADCRALTDEGVDVLARCCTRLDTVELIRCRFVGDDAVLALARHARSMHSLKLIGMPRLSNGGVVTLALHSTELRQLYIGFCELVNDGPIDALATGCPHLSVVQMWYCSRPSYDATRALERARKRLHQLQKSGSTTTTTR